MNILEIKNPAFSKARKFQSVKPKTWANFMGKEPKGSGSHPLAIDLADAVWALLAGRPSPTVVNRKELEEMCGRLLAKFVVRRINQNRSLYRLIIPNSLLEKAIGVFSKLTWREYDQDGGVLNNLERSLTSLFNGVKFEATVRTAKAMIKTQASRSTEIPDEIWDMVK